LLEARPVGIQSNFFDVGGHSLLVVKLFTRINQLFRCSLPIGAIFASPTIEQLATLIRGRTIDAVEQASDISESLARVSSAVVPIQPNGSAPPLFLIHGAYGHIVGFYELAMMTGTSHPMYGIQAQSLLAGQSALLRMEDLAAYYLAEIRRIQPKGPYYFLGYCFGGLVAYEIAQQLHAQGEQVEMLGMLDAFQHEHVPSVQWKDAPPKNASLRVKSRRRIARFVSNSSHFSLGKKIGYITERLLARVFYPKLAPTLRLRSVPSFMKVTKDINMLAARRYRFNSWPGSVILFRAAVQPHSQMPRDLGWSSVAEGGVEVIDVPGDHFEVLREPNIEILAKRLRERLERSDPTTPELLASILSTS
jgi:thioesterase domain-containing protein